MALPTILDLAKMNGSDAVVGLVDEATRAVPELSGRVRHLGQDRVVPNVGATRTIKGQQYKTLVRTSLPSAAFRDANEGTDAQKSSWANIFVETFILNPRWECDRAIADNHEDGPEAFIAQEADAVTSAAMMALGKQFYYGRGTGGDAKGHPGLINSVDAGMVVDATGTVDLTCSSVWAVTFGPKFVQWVFGMNGKMEITDVRVESLMDANSKRFTGFVQELLAYAGVQVLNKFSVGRIKKLTAEAGKGLTDARLGSLLALFPTGYAPDCFFASRRSLEQLRASRTATNVTGAEAPTPTEFQGIPLIPTDSILDTEALAL